MAFDPITAGFQLAGQLIDHFLPDRAANDAAKAELAKMQLTGELAHFQAIDDMVKAQIAVDQAEANNPSVFVAGWRPFIGWTCGSALACNYIIFPILTWITGLFGHPVQPPAIQLGDLIGLLTGMLGFGAMRSFDKAKGTDNGE